MKDNYETELRAALAEAEATNARMMAELKEVDAHPNSNEYKSAQWMTLIQSGRVTGLAQALNLLTGEDYWPDVTPK